MKNILTTALVSIIVFIGLSALQNTDTNIGATITTMAGSDTLKSSRTVINTNISNLNTDLVALEATTTQTLVTSIPNLITIGTIGTGVWQSTDIGVAYGGTGASSLTSNELLLGQGASAITTVSAGSNGDTLQLTAGVPTWSTASINLSNDYTWTGYHIFSTLFATNASTTNLIVDTSLAVDADATVTGVAKNASTTIFSADGTWTKPTGAKRVLVQAWGGGGSGAADDLFGGGGGGGEYMEMWFGADDLGATETVTVGDGGVAVTGDDSNGNAGGDSTFGSWVDADGGGGGIEGEVTTANYGLGGVGGSFFTATVTGQYWGIGAASDNLINDGIYSAGGGMYGTPEGSAAFTFTSKNGGKSLYGGAGGGSIRNIATNGTQQCNSLSGGTSLYGGNGGAGNCGGTGVTGTIPAGGGGATNGANTSGAGGDGQIIVTTYF